jgi:hypothetical protein
VLEVKAPVQTIAKEQEQFLISFEGDNLTFTWIKPKWLFL